MFNKLYVKKDLLISCQDRKDLQQWVKALHTHQLNTLERKMELFAKRISK